MRAWINSERGVGYVVCVINADTHTSRPVRNFGENQSAAIEFRNWIDRCLDNRLSRWVRMWADTYNPDDVYTYTDFDRAQPTFHRQKRNQA